MSTARLQPEDSTYWFVRTAFGWSVVLQLVWELPERPAPEALRRFASGLADGVLSRRLVPPRAPFARPRWEHAPHSGVPHEDAGRLSAAQVEAWTGQDLRTSPLDPMRGPAWRLRGVALDDGGYVLSLTALHLVADGRTLVTAALDALRGRAADPLTGRPAPGRAADLADGLRVLGAAARGIGRFTAATVRARGDAPPAPPRPRTPARDRAPLARPAWATVTVPADDWAKAARTHGGTPNTLFVAVLAGALRAAGYAGPLKLGIPVSTRADGDSRGNATAGVSVLLTGDPAPGDDLTALRRACKDAFVRLAAGARAPHVHLVPLLGLLPTRLVVGAVAAGNGMPDAVASNLGDFPAELARVGGVTAKVVTFRGDAQGVDPALPHRFGDGVQSWLLRTGDSMTFAVAAFDEQHFPGATLRTLLGAELDRWAVPHRLR